MTHQRPALFLDRDGVINIDHGYVHRREHFHFIPGIFELVRRANEHDFHVVIVTNQAGIARGYYSEFTFARLTHWMLSRFCDAGARIDAIYHCPHHPTAGLGIHRQNCYCRKPQPGLLLQAMAELDIAVTHSILIGDRPTDMLAGQRAGIPHLFLFNPQARSLTVHDHVESVVAIDHLLDPAVLHLLQADMSASGHC